MPDLLEGSLAQAHRRRDLQAAAPAPRRQDRATDCAHAPRMSSTPASRSRRRPAKPSRPMCARTRRSSSPRNRCRGGTCASTSRTTPRATSGCRSWPSACSIRSWRTVAEAGIGVGSAMRWIYDQFQRAIGGSPYPMRPYGVPKGSARAEGAARSASGRARSRQAVRGNSEDAGFQLPEPRIVFRSPKWCRSPSGNTKSNAGRSRSSTKRTGKMIRFKTDAIILEGRRLRSALCHLPPLLPARDLSLLARDLAGAGFRGPRSSTNLTAQSTAMMPPLKRRRRQVFRGEQALCGPWPRVVAQRRDLRHRARR